MIELRNVSFSYQKADLFHDLQIVLPDSGCVYIEGPSGCGKTTLLRLIYGILTPDSGTVIGLEKRTKAFVFQEDRLLPWLSVKENIEIVKEHSGKNTSELLNAFGLSLYSDEKVKNLSGGMKRRAAIARALNFTEDVLFLDEPFNGIDREMLNTITSFMNKKCKLIFLVSHHLEDAEALHYTAHLHIDQTGKVDVL